MTIKIQKNQETDAGVEIDYAKLKEILDADKDLKKQVTALFKDDRAKTYRIIHGKQNIEYAEGLQLAEILIAAKRIKSPFELLKKQDLSLV